MSNPIQTLLSRKSHPTLGEPAPSKAELDIMFKAALRAPDHAMLRPWRYSVFQGESLKKLGEMFVQAKLACDPHVDPVVLDKLRKNTLRAPMVIIASVVITEHPKVPEVEQVLSMGASVQNLLQAAHFQNIGAMWRTGELAYNSQLHSLLNLSDNEKLVGFIYLGREVGEKHPPFPINPDNFVSYSEKS